MNHDKEIFDGLKISEETALYEKYMGKFPVILFSLKSVNGAVYETARSLLCSVIGNEALRFYELLTSERLTCEEREVYKQLITIDETGQNIYTMSDTVLMRSLKTLSTLLNRHLKQMTVCILLC